MSQTLEAKKTVIKVAPQKMLASLLVAIKNTGTTDKALKDIFEDVLINFFEGKSIGVITASNGFSYSKVAFLLESVVDKDLAIRINANKLKNLLKTFENKEELQITITDKFIKLKADKTDLKLAIKDPSFLEEHIESIEFKKDKEVAKIKVKDLKTLVKEALSILKIDTEKFQQITFKTNADNISVRTGTTQTHTAMKSLVDATVESTDEEFSITKESAERLLTFLSVSSDKECTISVDESESKVEFRTSYGVFVTQQSDKSFPEAVYGMISKAVQESTAKLSINKEELLRAIKTTSLVKPDKTPITISLKVEGNKLILEARTENGEIKEEIEMQNLSGTSAEMNISDKVIENAVSALKDLEEKDNINLYLSKLNENVKVMLLSSTSKPEFSIIMAGVEE